MHYMGIDHHKQYSHITVLNEKGEVIKAERVWNSRQEVKEFLSGLVSTEIAEIERFSTDSQLHSYAGVIPSTHASGDRLYHGRLVQRGNKWLRWAAVEAVWPAVRSDFDIRLYYQRMKKRKGANSAKVATARRLLTIIYRVMKEKRACIPYKREKHTAAFTRI